jgi:adenine deaminase
MMNFPAVLARDPAVMAKIALARSLGLPVDGHAPGLTGEQARRYAEAGISTDHECASLEEARDKLAAGMRILIREGSAARNFDTLHPLIASHPDQVMFCSDDKHPDDLARGHIDRLAARAVAAGHTTPWTCCAAPASIPCATTACRWDCCVRATPWTRRRWRICGISAPCAPGSAAAWWRKPGAA